MSRQHNRGTGPAPASDRAPGGDTGRDEPVLPEVAREDLDEGWGDDPLGARRDEQWYRRERPPHHE